MKIDIKKPADQDLEAKGVSALKPLINPYRNQTIRFFSVSNAQKNFLSASFLWLFHNKTGALQDETRDYRSSQIRQIDDI